MGEDDEQHGGEHHQSGEGIDLRRDAPLHHGVDVKRQGGGVGPGHEEADDEII